MNHRWYRPENNEISVAKVARLIQWPRRTSTISPLRLVGKLVLYLPVHPAYILRPLAHTLSISSFAESFFNAPKASVYRAQRSRYYPAGVEPYG